MNKLSQFVEEDNGGLSATRLAFLLWAIGVLVVWMIASLKNPPHQPIDGTVTTILGILMAGKVVQKFGEKPVGDQTPAAAAAPAPPPAPAPAPAAGGGV